MRVDVLQHFRQLGCVAHLGGLQISHLRGPGRWLSAKLGCLHCSAPGIAGGMRNQAAAQSALQ